MESQQNSACLTIYNQRLVGMLKKKGFVLMEMAYNANYQRRHVFYFKDTELIRSLITDRFKETRK